MKQKVKDKIRYEYESFYLRMIGSSRENIYSNSEQIVRKRKISQLIDAVVEPLTEEQCYCLVCIPNLLDSIYLYLLEHGSNKKSIQKTMEEYIHEATAECTDEIRSGKSDAFS